MRRLSLPLLPTLVLAGAVVGTIAGYGPFGHSVRVSPRPGMVLISGSCGGPSFCITSPTPGPVLYPGAKASSLPLTFSNPLNVPIRVYALTVSFSNTFPTGCAPSALQVNGTGATGTTPKVTVDFIEPNFAVPPATGSTLGTATYPATLALADQGNQNACKNLPLSMSYTASAYFTVPTITTFVPSPSPATVGQPVMLRATVTPSITPSSAGSTPVGSVTFYRCTNSTSGCTTPLGSPAAVSSSGIASTTTVFNSQGTYYLQAVFTPTDSTNFSASTSSIVTEAANYTTCITTTSSASLTVAAGQTDCIRSTGKVSGNVTVNSGGRLDVLGGSVGSNVTVNSGGGLTVTGGSIAGTVSSTGANLFTICSANFASNVSASGTTAWVQVGDSDADTSPACGANSIAGNLTLTSNTAGAEVGANTVGGTLTLTGTMGVGPGTENVAPEIEKNTISGGLACSGNSPAPTNDNQANKVSGKRSGQCAAAGF